MRRGPGRGYGCASIAGGLVVTNLIALVLAVLILGMFALDATVLHLDLPVLVGREMLRLIEWVSFWR